MYERTETCVIRDKYEGSGTLGKMFESDVFLVNI